MGNSSAPTEARGPNDLDAWDTVQCARTDKNLSPEELFDEFVELNGDRAGDPAIDLRSWLARIGGRRAVVLDTHGKPLLASGFRKAHRCIELATRLHIPVVTLVDTPGADPSAASESEGIAGLIARTTEAMLGAPTPVLAIVTGEGGSGGALALATGDVLIAFETSVFSVIGPEGAAQIMWRDAARAPEAARLLKVGAHDLKELGIADSVIAGAPSAESIRQAVTYHLDRIGSSTEDPSPTRRKRWRGTW